MTFRQLARHLLMAISLLLLLSGALSPGPEIQNLSLTATSPGNLTTDDLICNYDLAGTATTAATAWYKDGSPVHALLMPFEGGAANALMDHSGNGQTATASGSPVWNATGGYGGNGAFEFDGVDDFLALPDAAALDVDYVTLAAWIYVDSFPNAARIISKETGTTEPYSIYTLMLTGTNDDQLELRVGVGGSRYRLIGGTPVPGGQWVHVAGTYDGSNMKIYVNGQIDETFPLGGPLMQNDNNVRIGSSEFYGRYFNGRIDDARIYGYALSAEQILALYNTGPNIIKYTETEVGELWHTRVTPFSSTEAGSTYVSNTVAIEVDSVPPVITSTPVTDAYAGWLYTYDVDASGYPLPTYALLTHPAGMSIDSTSGLIEWIPTAAGSEQVIVEASNSEGTDQQMFTITVQESLAVVRIMPLGNSITYDNHSGDIRPPEERISYRYPLWQLMTNAGYDFDFVGTLSAGGTFFPEPENDGRPGWTDAQIADSVYTFLQRNPADVVLLHIGTNGVHPSPDDVEDILNEIDRFELDYSMSIWVVLAKIINRSNYDATTTSFNTNVEAMALARTTD
ncbi:MAG: hypothetical protein JSW50_09030, partial [Candidatus Latescibacterota bacterium]